MEKEISRDSDYPDDTTDGSIDKEFTKESSLKSHMVDEHKFRKESFTEVLKVTKEEPLSGSEIKIEIKLEPLDHGEYYENLLEITDLKTAASYNNDLAHAAETKFTLEETCKYPLHQQYDIKLEDGALDVVADYNIKVEESNDLLSPNKSLSHNMTCHKILVRGLKKATPEVILNHFRKFGVVEEVEVMEQEDDMYENSACAFVTFKEEAGLFTALAASHEGLDKTVVCEKACIKSGKIGVNLPAKLNNMPDDVIKEFFESSYGKIIDFDRRKRVKRRQLKSFCWITFEDEKASKFLKAQRHVMFDGVQLDTLAFKEGNPRPARTSTYELLMKKTESFPQPNSLLLDEVQGEGLENEKGTDTDTISSMQVEYPQVPKPKPKQKVKCSSGKSPKVTKHPVKTQLPAIIPQYPSTAQYHAFPPPHPAMPPQYGYGYQNMPYGWSWGQAGQGYYPPGQFGYYRTQPGRPYGYHDDAGKLVQGRGRGARMWPY